MEPVCPTNLIQSTDPSKSTAMVVWTNPSASDTYGKDLEVICTPPSGSTFEIGETEVTCIAEDDKNEELACTFSVSIKGTLNMLKYRILKIETDLMPLWYN